MPLDEYRRKRDFSKTPEPRGETRSTSPRDRFFCVQKHLATNLHYDLRLEHNGVLLSWAVPKGPSLDPSIKRLAMHVEDHPVDYGEFEGVIPEGYGAGVVVLWDRGSWTPEVDDIDEALSKGDLKFRLDGYKLKGSWVLVRTRGAYPGARKGLDGHSTSWLLIKHDDEWSGALDITTFAPASVKSGGDIDDVLNAELPAVWKSRAAAAPRDLPSSVAQIVARADKWRATAGRTIAPAPSSSRTGSPQGTSKTPPRTTARRRTKRTGS
jgi:bifunctional non-homologous end joining protein LigD